MEKIADITVSGLLLVAGAGFLSMTFSATFDVRTFGGDVGPAFAPRLFLSVWVLLAALATVAAVRRSAPEANDLRYGQLIAAVVVATLTAFAMTRVGFLLSMVPGLVAFCMCFGYRRILPLLAVGIGAPLTVWALFTFGFELLLPRSPWFHQF